MPIPSGITIGWPSTSASIPAGWTRATALDDRHPKAIPNNATNPGSTGGTSTHSHTTGTHTHSVDHTHSGITTGAGVGTATGGTGGGGDFQTTEGHTHTSGTIANPTDTTDTQSPTSDTQNNDPSRWETIWITSDGTPTTIPSGAITHWNNASLPASWTQPANGQERFLRGAAAAGNGGATGGGAHSHAGGSHTHTSSHTHPNATSSAGTDVNTSGQAGAVLAVDTHTHAIASTAANFGTSNGASLASGTTTPDPPWIKLATIQSPGAAPVSGLICLWLGTLASIPTNWFLCDGTNGTPNLCQGNFIKGCTALAELLTTGGATGHTHAGTNHTHTWASAAHTHTLSVNATGNLIVAAGTGNSGSSAAHTHTGGTSGAASALTVGNAAPGLVSATHTPPYLEVAYVMYVEPGAAWLAALNTAYDADVTAGNVQLRLRVGMQNTGAGVGATAYKWQAQLNGGSWFTVTSATSIVKTFATSFYADGDDVPQLITSSTYQSDNNAAESSTGVFTLPAGLPVSARVESEIALEVIAADLADNDTLAFRLLLNDDTLLDTYTVTPTLTITKGGAPAVVSLVLPSLFPRALLAR